MPRKKHPNKHIEEALQYAESKGWRIKSQLVRHTVGEKCIVLRILLYVGIVFFALKASGLPPETHNNMPEIFNVPLMVV